MNERLATISRRCANPNRLASQSFASSGHQGRVLCKRCYQAKISAKSGISYFWFLQFGSILAQLNLPEITGQSEYFPNNLESFLKIFRPSQKQITKILQKTQFCQKKIVSQILLLNLINTTKQDISYVCRIKLIKIR